MSYLPQQRERALSDPHVYLEEVYIFLMLFRYDLAGTIEDREITQSEKVHLQKAESLKWSR